ncbi:hypothetical protein B0H16DRAFT_1731169 [Mycena metata]|uniref:Uncharacterized protein n=1 Tax=Mycena metata TaxID=1033252 RepID=A0AAD7MW59_9AGAR|nr:hypothetical protein B0H16DRAFT_1731169 [Mycena metata]
MVVMHLASIALPLLFSTVPSFVTGIPTSTQPEFYDPRSQGGSMLDNAGSGGGEPLNVIISGQSTPSVLTNSGFLGYAGALGFAIECFGMHMGDPQQANLGDGHGWVNQSVELRQDYGSAPLGTCWESIWGGNHLQDGNLANSEALFLAVSKEENVINHHTISPNGYNIGRDLLVQRAVGKTSFNGVRYTTTMRRIDGLMAPGSQGVNHGIATDGAVVLLTVIVG